MAEVSAQSSGRENTQAPSQLTRIKNYLEAHGVLKYIKSPRVAYGIAGFVALWLATGVFSSLLCNVIGFTYPAYKTIKAIESPDKDDDTEWLMYWVVFAAFSVSEFFSDIFLSWFPFYFLGKCIFLMWCMAPAQWNGSHVIYHKILKPLFLRNEVAIDDAIDRVAVGARDIINQGKLEMKDVAATAVASMVQESMKKDE